VPSVSEQSGLGSMRLEGAARATDTTAPPAASPAPTSPTSEGLLSPSDRTIYALELVGRNNVYCGSAHCVSALLAQGWRLSDPGQLAALVRDLATGRSTSTHKPSDHFE
jgi:hypothetical protein